jgi:hypothetical protein
MIERPLHAKACGNTGYTVSHERELLINSFFTNLVLDQPISAVFSTHYNTRVGTNKT